MNNHKKLWFAVDVVVNAAATEAIEFALNELGALGTEIDSFLKPSDKPMRVSGFFETLPVAAEVRKAVHDALRIYGFEPASAASIDTRTVEQTDWLAEWKKYWRPTVIGDFIIAPPWESVDADGRIVIRIEPNMAFGTGTHETTQLCVEVIGSELARGESFLDVGTGTGILAIAAAKLGDRRISACDIDEDSVRIAVDNASANGADAIQFFVGEIDQETDIYDFVCANLTIDVILPMLDLLLSKAKRILLLSGILAIQSDLITDALSERGISDHTIGTAGEWISVTVRKN
ncbi:MAG: 50S ribosomal protein L11 methyltransferase [Pyrinomonadaceae bacterium]|nr:50S ribosomal protein L11 methyltransferase [Pyrinomonadaceae bacterium]